MLEQQYSIHRKTIREYFPIQTTVVGMMRIFAQLLGLEFTELTGNNKTPDIVWHEDAQIFQVHDSQARGGDFLG